MGSIPSRRLWAFTWLLFLIWGLTPPEVHSQGTGAYWVSFKEKSAPSISYREFYSQKAIDRRHIQGIDSWTSQDWPIPQHYLDEVTSIADSLGSRSRWFNGVIAYCSNANQIERLRSSHFVNALSPLSKGGELIPTCLQNPDTPTFKPIPYANEDELEVEWGKDWDRTSYGKTLPSRRMGVQTFLDSGINGKGVIVAILDVGFKGANQHQAFQNLRDNNSILATLNIPGRDSNVYAKTWHGSAVLGCIAGYMKGDYPIGLATGAEYLLVITGKNTPTSLAFNTWELEWIEGAEWAEQKGAHIISSSLGYTADAYFPEQMDGETPSISKGTKLLYDRGVLVLISSGNERINNWGTLSAPADSKYVISVGATRALSTVATNYSSSGPTSDGRLKPELCAPGDLYAPTLRDKYDYLSGTSFSAPLVAGFAACLVQRYPKATLNELKDRLIKCGNLYPYYDYRHGYGMPIAKRAWASNQPLVPTFTMYYDSLSKKFVLESLLEPSKVKDSTLVFLHVARSDSTLRFSAQYKMERKLRISFVFKLNEGDIVRVSYRGYMIEYPVLESIKPLSSRHKRE